MIVPPKIPDHRRLMTMTSHKPKRWRHRDGGVRRPAVLVASVVGTLSVAGAALAVNSGVATLACGPLLIGWGS
jgi:hypothetical protein